MPKRSIEVVDELVAPLRSNTSPLHQGGWAGEIVPAGKDWQPLPAHPVANLFPMMGEVELAELADSIKQYGLANPIVVDREWQLVIDGRNRQRACEIAEVEPVYTTIDESITDLTAWVVMQNVKRRNLTAGHRAVGAARAWKQAEDEKRVLQPGETKRRPSSSSKEQDALIVNPSKHFGKMFGAGYHQVEQAKALIDESRADDESKALLAQLAVAAVMNGTFLAEAVRDYELGVGKDRNKAIRRQKLMTDRPDLFEKVERGEMTLDAAEQQATIDANEEKQRRWALTMNLLDGAKAFDRDLEAVKEVAAGYDPAHADGRGEHLSPERLRKIAAFAEALATTMEEGEDID
jgi:ParB-like chromosome segregation protein Spo0J